LYGLPTHFNIVHVSIFLGERLENVILFKIPENDANKVHKKIAVEFLTLIGSGRPKDGLRFFAPECKTHNPYVLGGMDALTDAMIAVQKQAAEGILQGSKADFKFIIKQVLADGDLVALHKQISSSKSSEGGLRQVHLFRFSGDKIVEYWDISQQVPKNAPNAAGAFS
jgi:predicted SnoaL-like aldol condensation-catalyzing enzyme